MNEAENLAADAYQSKDNIAIFRGFWPFFIKKAHKTSDLPKFCRFEVPGSVAKPRPRRQISGNAARHNAAIKLYSRRIRRNFADAVKDARVQEYGGIGARRQSALVGQGIAGLAGWQAAESFMPLVRRV